MAQECLLTTHQVRNLLILDGHGSHMKANFVSAYICNDIDMLVLPAHTLQKTQPLDQLIFGPLKASMAKQVDQRLTFGDVGRLGKEVWITMLAEARGKAISVNNIRVSLNHLLKPFLLPNCRPASDHQLSIPSCHQNFLESSLMPPS
jgi:hypothetical protein